MLPFVINSEIVENFLALRIDFDREKLKVIGSSVTPCSSLMNPYNAYVLPSTTESLIRTFFSSKVDSPTCDFGVLVAVINQQLEW